MTTTIRIDFQLNLFIVASTKLIIFGVIFGLLRSTGVRLKIREEAAKCLGNLAIGDGEYFTQINLEKFLTLVKSQKDATLNIAIADALASTLCGYDVTDAVPPDTKENIYCDDKDFEHFLNLLVRLVTEPNPHARQSCSVWLLALVKHCSYRPSVVNRKQLLQYAFTELLSDDSGKISMDTILFQQLLLLFFCCRICSRCCLPWPQFGIQSLQ